MGSCVLHYAVLILLILLFLQEYRPLFCLRIQDKMSVEHNSVQETLRLSDSTLASMKMEDSLPFLQEFTTRSCPYI
jgi:hypothetical protein